VPSFKVKLVEKAMEQRRNQQPGDADDRKAAVPRVERGEKFTGRGPQRVDRPIPPRIIDAFSSASIHGSPSMKW
jgi:hypothetical protein